MLEECTVLRYLIELIAQDIGRAGALYTLAPGQQVQKFRMNISFSRRDNYIIVVYRRIVATLDAS